MNKQRTIRRTLLAMALAALGASGTALAVDESEQNSPIQSAQQLAVGAGSIVVNGAIRHPAPNVPDVDFYSFEAKAGDIITVNIDGTNGLDASLFLFDPALRRRFFSMDAPLDGGSNNEADPRIDAVTLDTAGRWTVGVTSHPIILRDGGTMSSTSTQSSGVYTLIISGLTPAIQHIAIDIKPGSAELTPINPKAKGVIPVALLSSNEFDPLQVDVTSLSFGATGDETSFIRCVRERQDFNADGKPDLVCNFDNGHTNFVRGDSMGVVKGKTRDGKAFVGRGDLKVVPEKRGN